MMINAFIIQLKKKKNMIWPEDMAPATLWSEKGQLISGYAHPSLNHQMILHRYTEII